MKLLPITEAFLRGFCAEKGGKFIMPVNRLSWPLAGTNGHLILSRCRPEDPDSESWWAELDGEKTVVETIKGLLDFIYVRAHESGTLLGERRVRNRLREVIGLKREEERE